MQSQGARVVTPEAVVLDVQTAGLGSRVFARAIDVAIQGAAIILLVTGFSLLGTAGLVVSLIAITVIAFAYPIIWEWLWRGRTPGKAALGLRVVTRQGAPVHFRHAAVRGLIGLGEVLALPVVGVLSMLASANDQRLGDMAAGTIVIRERAAAHQAWPVVFYPPPGWERYVASLDVSAMSAGEYETVRSFLLRAHEMAPVPRSNLAVRLAGPLADRWHQPVPPGVGPDLWLACVASAYQRHHAPSAGSPPGIPPPYGPPAGYGPPGGGYGAPGGYGGPPTSPPVPLPPEPPAPGGASFFPPEVVSSGRSDGGFAPPD